MISSRVPPLHARWEDAAENDVLVFFLTATLGISRDGILTLCELGLPTAAGPSCML